MMKKNYAYGLLFFLFIFQVATAALLYRTQTDLHHLEDGVGQIIAELAMASETQYAVHPASLSKADIVPQIKQIIETEIALLTDTLLHYYDTEKVVDISNNNKQADTEVTQAHDPQVQMQQQEAHIIASNTIRRAISSGRWTNEDAQALASHIGVLPPMQKKQLIGELVTAINRQEIELESMALF